MLPLLVPARRGKFSPGAVSAAPGDKEARRVVPVPCTQQQEAAEARLYDEVEGFSRPVSPTTHLHKVHVPTPPIVRKRKSFSKRLLESFRETRNESVLKEELLNKYVKTRLSEDHRSHNIVTNNSSSNVSKVERVVSKLSRRNSEFKSFLVNSFKAGDYRAANFATSKQGGARPLVACRYREAGCGLRFSSGRPQLRLQHEAACRHVTVGCHWTGDTCRHVPLRGAERHLLAEHGDTVRRVEQRGELAVSLAEGAAAWAGHGEASWPDTLGCCGPRVIIVRALGHSFLLFLRHQELLSEEYDIAVAALGTQQLANRFGYELRLYDQAGYAYRGPMLSAATPAEKFWSQGYHLHIPNLEVLGSFFETTVRIFHWG